MISASEAGLSSTDYAALVNEPASPDLNAQVRVVLRNNTLNWQEAVNAPASGSPALEFELALKSVHILWNGNIFKWVQKVSGAEMWRAPAWNDGANAVWQKLTFSMPSNWIQSEPPAFVVINGELELWAICATGLHRCTFNVPSSLWMSWTTAVSTSSFVEYVQSTNFSGNLLSSGLAAGTGLNLANAFDEDAESFWRATSLPAQIGSSTGAASCARYRIVAGPTPAETPSAWTLEGWNGTAWVVIDTRTGEPTWKKGESRTFTPTGTGTYTGFRLNISAAQSGTAVSVAYFEVNVSISSSEVSIHNLACQNTDAGPTAYIHFQLKMAGKEAYRLGFVQFNQPTLTFQVGMSDIYYPFRFDSCAVTAVPGTNREVLVAATDMPGRETVRASGAQTEYFVYRRQGLIAFRFNRPTDGWGRFYAHHTEIEVSDFKAEWRSYDLVTATTINERIVVVARAREGTREHVTSFFQAYQSVDGLNWTLGTPLGFFNDSASPLSLFAFQNALYAVQYRYSYSSPPAYWLGEFAPHTKDITDYVLSGKISMGEMASASYDLDDAYATKLTDLPGASPLPRQPADMVVPNQIVENYVGYTINDSPAMVRAAITEVDALDASLSPADRTLRLNSRDLMAWMTDKTRARNNYQRRLQFSHFDRFKSDIASAYGGLRNTAARAGIWKTQEWGLLGRTDQENREAIAFSVAKMDFWNGIAEARIQTYRHDATVMKYTGVYRAWTYRNEPEFYYAGGYELNAPINLSQGWSPPGIGANNNYRVLFELYIQSPTSGDYTFTLNVAGGASLYINGELVIAGYNDIADTMQRRSGKFTMTAGVNYPCQIMMQSRPGADGGIQFMWTPPGGSEVLVPASAINGDIENGSNPPLYRTGLMFRAINGENGYIACWDSRQQVLMLIERRDGIDRELARTSPPPGYSSGYNFENVPSIFFYLGVECYYNRIRVYEYEPWGPKSLTLEYILSTPTEKVDAEGKIPISKVGNGLGYVGHYVMGANMSAAWRELRVHDFNLPFSIEDSVKHYAALANIHRTSFITRVDQRDGPLPLAGPVGGSMTVAANTAQRLQIISTADRQRLYIEGLEQPQSIKITFRGRMRNAGVMLFGTPSVGTAIGIGLNESNVPQVWRTFSTSANWLITQETLRGAVPDEELEFEVWARRVQIDTQGNTRHTTVSMFINGQLAITYTDEIAVDKSAFRFGFLSMAAGALIDISDFRVADLCEAVDVAVLDPDEPPQSGLGRLLEGLPVQMYIRPNGALRVFRSQAKLTTNPFTLRGDVEAHGRTKDLRGLKTYLRVVGAFVDAEVANLDLMERYGYRFGVVNNPFLLTSAECRSEASRLFRQMESTSELVNLILPANVVTELEDCVYNPLAPSEKMFINSKQYNIAAGEIIEELTLRQAIVEFNWDQFDWDEGVWT